MLLSSFFSLVRKWTPALFFLLLGVALLYGHEALLLLTNAMEGASVAQGADMSGAEVAAEAKAAGWVPFGTWTSKLLAAGGAFLLACILVWRMQRLVLPAPSAWARKGYSVAFDSLSDELKFKAYASGRWQLIVLMSAALIFAACAQ